MTSDEWFKLVDIALDKFSLKIVNHKSHLQFCTIKAGKVFYVVASFLLGISVVCHLLIQNGPWSFTFLADIFQSKVHFEDALCNTLAKTELLYPKNAGAQVAMDFK